MSEKNFLADMGDILTFNDGCVDESVQIKANLIQKIRVFGKATPVLGT